MCDSNNNVTATVHPWEKSGLGKAPFTYLGMKHSVGPIKSEVNGCTLEVGSPGQPMGTCAYCGQGIAYCCNICSADGKKFTIGTVCVEKICGPKSLLTKRVKRERGVIEKQGARVRQQDRRNQLAADYGRNLEVQMLLNKHPHPNAYYAGQGQTLGEHVQWMIAYGGNATVIKVIRAAYKLVGIDIPKPNKAG